MRHRKAKITIDRTAAQRGRLIRNLTLSLLRHERIVTTPVKARAVRSAAERLITIGKKKTLAHQRLVRRTVQDDAIVRKIFDTLGPRYLSRPGGYSRLVRMQPRQGDGADQTLIELITS